MLPKFEKYDAPLGARCQKHQVEEIRKYCLEESIKPSQLTEKSLEEFFKNPIIKKEYFINKSKSIYDDGLPKRDIKLRVRLKEARNNQLNIYVKLNKEKYKEQNIIITKSKIVIQAIFDYIENHPASRKGI